MNPSTHRVHAVDVMRAITMTLMLFVNDFAGIPDIPYWLKHAEATEDMMGFSDLVFPAFIFCMGMSVVPGIEARYRKGATDLQVIGHILERTIALIVMGLFTLNCGSAGALSYPAFMLLMVAGFFLVWAVYPAATGWKHVAVVAARTAGVAVLGGLLLYKDMCGKPFHTGWWGILGLIGYTYAACAAIHLFARHSLRRNIAAWAALMLLMLAGKSELVPYDYATRAVFLTFLPGDMTLNAIGYSGVLTILMLRRERERPARLLTAGATAGAAMLVLALVCHHHWIISKIQATPTWGFFCLAGFFPMAALLFWLCDLRGHASWFAFIKPAGTATLTCYMIPYVWYAIMWMSNIDYPDIFNSGYMGLVRSAIFALVVVRLTGLLTRCHIRLKV